MLGQYRFPVRHYWRGLTVQLVAYEAQYELQSYFSRRHVKDNMDYAVSNTMGAIAAVLAACLLSFIVEHVAHRPCERAAYCTRSLRATAVTVLLRTDQKQLLHTKSEGERGCFGKFCFDCGRFWIRAVNCIGIGRKSDLTMLDVEKKMAVAADPARVDVPPPITLEEREEDVLMQTVVELEPHNVWSVLMPAVYQLVPGSMIGKMQCFLELSLSALLLALKAFVHYPAKLWFNTLFPPSMDSPDYEAQNNVFSNLMVISTSLAIGLILGFAIVHSIETLLSDACCKRFRLGICGQGCKCSSSLSTCCVQI